MCVGHAGCVGVRTKTKSYERLCLGDQQARKGGGEFRRRESMHCKAETPDIILSFFVALLLISKVGQ
jgi:hypothetical protein